MCSLELLLADVAECQVKAVSIVVNLDLFEHEIFGLFARGQPLAVNRLNLEAMIPTLHCCVVVTIALGAHTGDQSVRIQQVAMLTRAVLAAAVGMHDHAMRPFATEAKATAAA